MTLSIEKPARRWRAAEFFAGIGLAKEGLRPAAIDVTWSNDISATKHALFAKNFGSPSDHVYVVKDLAQVQMGELPHDADLAWASFPCTDLSVAGGRAGLHRGKKSSTFWHFVKALSKLGADKPPVVALENVTAFATSHAGRDIASAIRALNGLGYSVDVLCIDARRFLPQSRPRLFLIGTTALVETSASPSSLRPPSLDHLFEDPTLITHRMKLPEPPELLTGGLADYLEELDETDPRWWTEDRVAAFTRSLSDVQTTRFSALLSDGSTSFRTAYRRMRNGVPRWEIRSDEIAGCLRTSSGGSSKQAVVEIGAGRARVRWMTPWEYASLMGVPAYALDGVRDSLAYSGFGDAVCAPVVEWLAKHCLAPALTIADRSGNTSTLSHSFDLAS